jgi:hypothetical protein
MMSIASDETLTNVRFWHESEVVALLAYVRYRGKTGKHLLVLSLTDFDPQATLAGSKSRSAAVLLP